MTGDYRRCAGLCTGRRCCLRVSGFDYFDDGLVLLVIGVGVAVVVLNAADIAAAAAAAATVAW